MSKQASPKEDIQETESFPTQKQTCGIIMPISPIDGCSAEHWAEILSILKDVAISIDFIPNLVSDSDDSGIIQKRIIQNIYNSDLVICDVSGKNPNVMFELGMRLAFDKATIIIKDDKTDYSFDTSVIEHLGYPRDLRFQRIVEFKDNLRRKLKATYEKSKASEYSTFLKSFGEYKVAQLEDKVVTSDKFLISAISDIKAELLQMRNERHSNSKYSRQNKLIFDLPDNSITQIILDIYEDLYGDSPINSPEELDVVKKNLYEIVSSNESIRKKFPNSVILRANLNKILDNLVSINF